MIIWILPCLQKKKWMHFNRGIEAFDRDTPEDCNPFPKTSKLFDFWHFGWGHGKDVKCKRDEEIANAENRSV
jgi:hypothetical protein